MMSDRRTFLGQLAGAAVSVPALAQTATPKIHPSIKAIAFDAFAILDPRPVASLASELFADRGPALWNAWRTRQFEYAGRRTLSHRYSDFWQVTDGARPGAAKECAIDLPA